MLASTTPRPAARASRTFASTSAEVAPAPPAGNSSPSAPAADRCPATRRAPAASSRGPTKAKREPSASYARASSGATGSCRSSVVVTKFTAANLTPLSLPKGIGSPDFRPRPYRSLRRPTAAASGSMESTQRWKASMLSPSSVSMAWRVVARAPGPAMVFSDADGMPTTLAASIASGQLKGQYTTPSGDRSRKNRTVPGIFRSRRMFLTQERFTILNSRPSSWSRSPKTFMTSTCAEIPNISVRYSTVECHVAPVSTTASRNWSKDR
mmetsp:Transcript_76992/g.218205  ORF Transcript_76992/g.218205 Transcript_76992/m.218205 type:complete len:267 (-) Transcript_76992:225-1025(-)